MSRAGEVFVYECNGDIERMGKLDDDGKVIEDDSGPKDGYSSNFKQQDDFSKLRRERAVHYYRQVEERAGKKKHVMNGFLCILEQFQRNLIDHCEVVRRMAALFADDDDIILKMNSCLPPGCKILVRKDNGGKRWLGYLGLEADDFIPLRPAAVSKEDIESNTVKHEQQDLSPRDIRCVGSSDDDEDGYKIDQHKRAADFIRQVKSTVDKDQFASFIRTMQNCQGRKDLNGRVVYQELHPILRMHKHLLDQVIGFLKDEATRSNKKNAQAP